MALLDSNDPPSFTVAAAGDRLSPFLLTCDHAGNRLPRALGTLGLPQSELQRHIAWDIGAAAVTRQLSTQLGATAILQTYSRLAIDCNRPLDAPDSIALRSELTVIPGNQALSNPQTEVRAAAIFRPYHERIAKELDARQARGQPTILIAMHSFTPRYVDEQRPWHIGVLYHRDTRLAQALLRELRLNPHWTVGDNQPYSVSDETDYTLPVHGERRGLLHAGLEIRQDLIGDAPGQARWAAELAAVLPRAAAGLFSSP